MIKVELKVFNILDRIPSYPGLFVLLLKEVGGERKLPIVVGLLEAQAIAFKMHSIEPRRPSTHDLFVTIFDTLQVKLNQVLIYQIDGGTFYSYLIIEDKEERVRQVDSRTSDAVALAMRLNAPIYIFDTLLDDYCLRDNSKENSMPIPLAGVDTTWLKDALTKAVKEENYEWASKLRDELNRRNL